MRNDTGYKEKEIDMRCQTVWIQPCVDWTLCVKIAKKLWVRKYVWMCMSMCPCQVLYVYACYLFVCMLCIHLRGLVRHLWGSHHHLGSHLAVKCGSRERGDEGGRQLVQPSAVFIWNKRDTWFTKAVDRLQKSQQGKESVFTVWVLNSTAMKIDSAYIRLLGIWYRQ